MQAYVDSRKVAGAVLVIARHGRIGYMQAIGFMNLEKKIPMRTDAVFRIASFTKPIIAAAILKLVGKGNVRLDDPVTKYIPAFAGLQVSSGGESQAAPRPPQRVMTVADLLTHTSGLTSSGGAGYSVATLRSPGRTLAEFADTIAKLPLIASPEEKWEYNGLGYDVLGRIIEVASGRTLSRYLDEEIFAPLRMRETSFHVKPTMESRIPVVYSREKDGTLRPDAEFLAPAYLPTSRFLSGGGGLLSTPADYVRFAQMLLNGGKLDGKRILSPASVATMMRNHIAPSLTPIVTPVFDHTGYGFGLGGAVLVDSTLSGEPGSLGIYRWAGSAGTFFWIDPKKDLIAMLFTQSRTIRYQMERAFQQLVYAAVLP
ncbi:MAG: beta-lactamase family protein [Cytophagaceae bacterium]|nr:beta-lactamase family protein [Cytophagaceae bacterium]